MHQPCALMVQVFLIIATKSNLYPHGKKIILSASCATIISKGRLGKLTTDCFIINKDKSKNVMLETFILNNILSYCKFNRFKS